MKFKMNDSIYILFMFFQLFWGKILATDQFFNLFKINY